MTAVLFMTIPQAVLPDRDSDFSRVSIEMVPGTTLEQTEEVADQVAAIIEAEPEVAEALERIREGNRATSSSRSRKTVSAPASSSSAS